jgi:hypothetical protein
VNAVPKPLNRNARGFTEPGGDADEPVSTHPVQSEALLPVVAIALNEVSEEPFEGHRFLPVSRLGFTDLQPPPCSASERALASTSIDASIWRSDSLFEKPTHTNKRAAPVATSWLCHDADRAKPATVRDRPG